MGNKYMNGDPRGALIQQGNLMRIENAFVEETSCSNNSNDNFIVVSYANQQPTGIILIETIRLNITRNTVLLNSFGQSVCRCCVQEGMYVNVIFSSRMTRSIPPQANAFFIIIQRGVQPASEVSVGRIASIDLDNGFLYTGNPNNINTQTRYVITGTTLITNRFGIPISLNQLRPGQTVRITHANFMTASIPPQTTAFRVQVI